MVEAAQARKVITENNWIDGKTSQNVLRSIIFGKSPADAYTCDPRVDGMIKSLKSEYWDIRNRTCKAGPRNLPFLQMVTRKYANFSWRESAGSIHWPVRVGGVAPSLLTLLLGLVPEDEFDPIASEPDAPLAARLREVLGQAEIVAPEPDVFFDVLNWIKRGQAGQPLTIVSPVCPDYEVEDGTAAKHRFTFRGLGSTAGLTARRIFATFVPLGKFLREELGLEVSHVICPGDFEGLSDEVNARMGIDRAEFMARLELGRQDIEATSPAPVEGRFFTDLCGGQAAWTQIHHAILDDFANGELTAIRDLPWVRRLAGSRAELYRRWYGGGAQSADFYLAKVLEQGAEYYAMGKIIREMSGYADPLVLGADDHRMGRFYRLTGPLPVLYVERNYE